MVKSPAIFDLDKQKGAASLIPMLLIVAGLVVGVYFIEQGTGFLSKALEVIGPSKSATIKIPLGSPRPTQIASGSGSLATGSAKPNASATASASLKPSPTASASAKASPSPK